MFKPFQKVASVIVTLVLVTLLLTACGSNTATNAPVSPTSTTNNEIRIGILTTSTGPFTALGQDALRGVELAVGEENGGVVAGKKIVLVKEGTDATPEVARAAARKLVDQAKVDFIVGPLSGDEGLAVRNYAKTKPEMVFINGSAGAQDITLRDASPNFYRFNADGAQTMGGLGSYVFNTQNYRRVAVLAEDYSYPYSQVGGFMSEYCRAGGRVVKKFWVPVGTSDYSKVLTDIPSDIDAIFVALAGSDAVNFLKQYEESGGKAALIGGSITADSSTLSVKGSLAQRLVGMASSNSVAEDNPDPAWQKFVQAYKTKFPDGLGSPSFFAHSYYVNTKAALLALKQVNGDLSNGQARFKEALSNLQFQTPTGLVKLDKNRNAIVTVYLSVIDRKPDGTLYNKLVKTVPNVNQTLGIAEEEYLKAGPLGRDNPSCP